MAGKFIVFEGLDGSGKGTMLALTADYIFNSRKEFDKLLLTREPTSSAVGNHIRKILAKDLDPMSKAKQLLQLYLDDRKEHLEKVIKPAIQKNVLVLCDRYKHSTLCYQQTQGIPFEKIQKLHEKMLVPDLTIILDVPPAIALERIAGDRTGIEKFEKDFFLSELRENYKRLPEKLSKENIKIIDASGSIKQVFSLVKKEVEKVL